MMKRLIIAGMFGATMLVTPLVGMGSAHAASNNYCGSSENGCDHTATAGAQCGTGAGSGAFGAFGKNNNFAGGADGTQTGLNNSALCGNRQGNLP
jgi:hypothetical protein